MSNKQFKAQTIQSLKELRAADANGKKLESLETGLSTVTCREMIAMPKTKKEDGHNRSVLDVGPLKSDLHNISNAINKEVSGVELETRQERRLARKKKRYMRRVLRRSISKLDDDSITMNDVSKAFDDSIADGSACAGKKVLSRGQMRRQIIERLQDKSQRSVSVNGDSAELKKDMETINFINGGDKKSLQEIKTEVSKS